jgi:hypothetical protein
LVTYMIGARRIVLMQDALKFLRGVPALAAGTTQDQEGASDRGMV